LVDDAQRTRSLKDEVAGAFAQLLANGDLTIHDVARGRQPFGNEWVALQGRGFRLRLTTDRGSEDAELAFNGDSEWYPLDWVVAALQLQSGKVGYPGPPRSIAPAEASLLAGTLVGGRWDSETRSRATAELKRFERRRLGELEGSPWPPSGKSR
jgi:hypothetical protein